MQLNSFSPVRFGAVQRPAMMDPEFESWFQDNKTQVKYVMDSVYIPGVTTRKSMSGKKLLKAMNGLHHECRGMGFRPFRELGQAIDNTIQKWVMGTKSGDELGVWVALFDMERLGLIEFQKRDVIPEIQTLFDSIVAAGEDSMRELKFNAVNERGQKVQERDADFFNLAHTIVESIKVTPRGQYVASRIR